MSLCARACMYVYVCVCFIAMCMCVCVLHLCVCREPCLRACLYWLVDALHNDVHVFSVCVYACVRAYVYACA